MTVEAMETNGGILRVWFDRHHERQENYFAYEALEPVESQESFEPDKTGL